MVGSAAGILPLSKGETLAHTILYVIHNQIGPIDRQNHFEEAVSCIRSGWR